uniref:Uncharacterized protein n=1 Tax=Anguilla anguilla TaxID=7936 RepID=A0A0E9VSB1_ANGAN
MCAHSHALNFVINTQTVPVQKTSLCQKGREILKQRLTQSNHI